jgi:hypothetical protein
LLSIEEGTRWDNSINNLSMNNDFEFSCLDATDNRSQNIRSGFTYYRGIDSSGSPFGFPFSERRRIAIIDNSDPANPVIKYNAIPQSDSLSANDVTTLQAAINSVLPAPARLDFAAWLGRFTFPADQDGANNDPDRDGAHNLLEFFSGTDPLAASSVPVARIEKTNEKMIFRYHVAKDHLGMTHRLQTGPLDSLTDFVPSEQEITPVSEKIDEITVTLTAGTSGFIRQIVTLEP